MAHPWLVDPLPRTLEVLRLEGVEIPAIVRAATPTDVRRAAAPGADSNRDVTGSVGASGDTDDRALSRALQSRPEVYTSCVVDQIDWR